MASGGVKRCQAASGGITRDGKPMSTDSQQIVSRAWNFAHVLRDDGLSYLAYTEQITDPALTPDRSAPAARTAPARTPNRCGPPAPRPARRRPKATPAPCPPSAATACPAAPAAPR